MFEVAVIEDPVAAQAALDPARARLLGEPAEPASAATPAGRLGSPRQEVHHHLRARERPGPIEPAEERREGNVIERVMRGTAASSVISPVALAAVAPDPARAPDQLSARWLLAVAARLVRDVGHLVAAAARARRRVATFTIDGEVRFASAADRAAFAQRLAEAVTALAGEYHDEKAEGGRVHRLIVAMHPYVANGQDGDVEGGVR
ncbi:transcriptional regulator [Sphaerisporangium melleum]|uniref:Transcriptional regulator n=1 Tax=Sphaerisporangium melleum TaxID=321316 RepID=A0A917RFP6_9ACTN|nr:helix-turn-helix domain-containing protein [Sphaerisporangium melleum]GGL05859.1 transcriptional regulator [Sphaerisporangium melleum]GII73153.1 transcriptional regulator [Sphaerisporangium melleum]